MHTLEQLRNGSLAGSRRLDLSCGLRAMPPEVFDLADSLEVLNLSGNQLSDLPIDLPRLHRLKVIFCSDNDFTHLPEVLGACPRLEMVGFKANRIAQVSPQALPPRLRWLILTDNALVHLPDALGERPALQKLMLAGNRLGALPDSLAQAQQLELVRLAANGLTQLPSWLCRLPRLAWVALAGNPMGWTVPAPAPLPSVPWRRLRVGARLGEGASGHIHEAQVVSDNGDEGGDEAALALKLFKGQVTSDGLPQDELAACLVAGAHPALCTPVATVHGHPEGLSGLALPLLPGSHRALAGPPSLDSCTRDVYPPGFAVGATPALKLAATIAQAVAHLHARGVLHGDLYGHNILWDPATGNAVLSDFGAATLLPTDQAALCCALQATDVRAFGCLLEELSAHAHADDGAPTHQVRTVLGDWATACLHPAADQRPSMAQTAAHLAAQLAAHLAEHSAAPRGRC